MKSIFKTIVVSALAFGVLVNFHYASSLAIPLKVTKDTVIEKNLAKLGAPTHLIPQISSAVQMAANQTNITPNFIIALMYTESTFFIDAKSIKGYNGLMQIPHDVKYIDANVLIGARIFKDKLHIANGNIKTAICLYKGWPPQNARGIAQANKVISIYNSLATI